MDHLLAALRPVHNIKFPTFIRDYDEDTGDSRCTYQVPNQAFDLSISPTTKPRNQLKLPLWHPYDEQYQPKDPDDEQSQRLYNQIVDLGRQGNHATMAEQSRLWRQLYLDFQWQLGFCHHLLWNSWFGALTRFINIDVNADDFFVDDPDMPCGVALTTKRLQYWLSIWQDRVLRIKDDDDRARELARASKELSDDAQVLNSLFLFLRDHVYTHARANALRDFDALGMTQFACMLMQQALHTAIRRMSESTFEILNEIVWGPRLPWLRHRMELDGWCPYTISRLFTSCDMDQVAVIYAIGTARSQQSHQSCTPDACVCNNTSIPDLDFPKHICPQPADCAVLPLFVEDLVNMIEQGGVPVIQFSVQPTGIGFQVHASEDRRYVAISHIWADGLGDMSLNAIAVCQLIRLKQRLLQIEEKEGCEELCVWIDTLCIPIGEEYQHLRNLQIQRMASIYRDAFAVLVIDADTLDITPSSALPDIVARLTVSAWSSRLWTYQEGMLNSRLLLMTHDGVVDLDALVQQALTRERNQDALEHNLLEKAIRTIAVTIGRPHSYERFLDGHHRPEGASVFRLVHNFSRQEGDVTGQRMLQAIQDRTSTRLDDETVIIASGLGVDVSKVISAPTDQKMVALLQAMSNIPANMLFTLGPRIMQSGFRWAPVSCLRAKGGCAVTVVDDMVPWTEIQFQMGALARRPKSVLAAEHQGLLTFNPAVRLDRVLAAPSGVASVMMTLNGTNYALIPAKVDAASADADSERTQEILNLAREGQKLVVLLHEFNPNKLPRHGVLAKVLHESSVIPDYQDGEPDLNAATKVQYCLPVMLLPKTLMQAVPQTQRSEYVETAQRYIGTIGGKAVFGPVLPPEMMRKRQRDVEVEIAEEKAEATLKDYQAEWIWPRWWLID